MCDSVCLHFFFLFFFGDMTCTRGRRKRAFALDTRLFYSLS